MGHSRAHLFDQQPSYSLWLDDYRLEVFWADLGMISAITEADPNFDCLVGFGS